MTDSSGGPEPIELRAKTMLKELADRATATTSDSDSALLEALWTSPERYGSHVAKRLGNKDIQDAADYALKTFSVLALAKRMSMAIADNDYASGKLQAEAAGWVVLIGNNGHIITSHPFDPQKTTFEERHQQAGEQVYDYFIDGETRELLARLFARY